MQQFLIPSSTGSPQIINIPVSLLSQNSQQPVSLITANGQIFQLPVSQLVVHQNSDGSTTTTSTTAGPASSNVASNSASVSNTASSSSTSSSSNSSSAPNSNAQLVINHQGQLISLPVIQAATAGQSNQSAAFTNNGSLQTVNFVSLAGSNNVQLHAINRNQASSTATANTNNNSSQAPIKSLLDDDDKSDNDDQGQTIAQMPLTSQMTSNGSITHGTTVDGVNLDEIREFAKAFKLRRLALGLTQTQVGQALSATKGPAYSQSAICRFEKLDITPKSAAKIKPVLEKWMQEAELKYADRLKSGSHHNYADLLGTENSKKRKRRTSFTPQALEILNEYFEKNSHPSGNQGADMTMLAQKLNYDREVIRVWFCNKRQALKNTLKKVKQEIVSPNGAVSNVSLNVSNSGTSTTISSTSLDQSDVSSTSSSTPLVTQVTVNTSSTVPMPSAELTHSVSNTLNQSTNDSASNDTLPTKTVITLTNNTNESLENVNKNEMDTSESANDIENKSINQEESKQTESSDLTSISTNHTINNIDLASSSTKVDNTEEQSSINMTNDDHNMA